VANAVRVIDLQASCLSEQYDVFRKDRGCDSLLFVSGQSNDIYVYDYSVDEMDPPYFKLHMPIVHTSQT